MKSAEELKDMKGKEKISMLTCYDYSFAKAMDGKVDMILVGDSLGNVVLGYERTKKVTMQDMIRHVEAVSRGATDTHIVGDLPYGSYETKEGALENARKLISAGAHSVKPEGKPEIVEFLVKNDVSVVAHLGLLPQTAEKLGVVRGEEIISQATKMEEIGAFVLIIECVPNSLAKEITNALTIPTIGIGAGNKVDGQVLVSYDMLGLYPDLQAKFVRQYADLKKEVSKAVEQYSSDVKKGSFPSEEESFK
ncbi:3-methyl-2-oxobutanoate hydroxymethyltransferase [Candidatus Woesearchaeota archaeon]|nr:3-methyl-2-oxobutanoate hydroxymethyltransferase [Candidatus Woesearchaeota archaeon]